MLYEVITQSLAKIVAYAIGVNVCFFRREVFVAFYSNIPEHMDHIKYLFVGLHGHGAYVPVITSYSIHYTKLYEVRMQALNRLLAAIGGYDPEVLAAQQPLQITGKSGIVLYDQNRMLSRHKLFLYLR